MSGHAFVRPGQVAPHLPPPDACVQCGLPAAAHGFSAELSARRTAATAALGAFRREVDAFVDTYTAPEPDAIAWARRLAAELRSLLEQLDKETAEPDVLGGYRLTIRQALRDAIRYQNSAVRGSRDQIGLYRSAARHFSISVGDDL